MHDDFYAAIDLGSNSFHMLLVQQVAGSPRIISKVKRKVRLASGLDHDSNLSLEAMERGWQCLELFAERLAHIPKENIRVVSTATLRLAKNSEIFCEKGQQILGQRIDVISGEQEAALIYHGMAVSSNSADKRLIIDIGGASTELILGQGLSPIVLNSLNMGCVTWIERYFSGGLLTQANFEVAIEQAAQVLASVKQDYLNHQWQLTLGASGSVQAVQEVLIAQGETEQVTLAKLEALMVQVIACGSVDKLALVGLQPERAPVFASGVAILIMLFRNLSIETMVASGGALREGLIAQLLSGSDALTEHDVTARTCQHLQQRFQVDTLHAQNVAELAVNIATPFGFDTIELAMLSCAAQLHEVGLSVEFLQGQRHGAYLLANLVMPGFTTEQKKLVVALVGNYKNPLNSGLLEQQACCSAERVHDLISCLRLAVIISGRYQGQRAEQIVISKQANGLVVNVEKSLAATAPLLLAELTTEVELNPRVFLA
ncbi:guanosine-5'-triphosphate,3'-diphosphate pyrophosphatase [Psychrobium sp. 1_MG-2023]|uniref:Ppx/GppA phosphatase family protein n=1 Tax=Psychrobium sp. 1_MG-2023 TaxID=3062624 RepID=UPI0027352D31|nr:guanosine-5'-triphosphate,3'-diphosphate pyrophosphatase [Psychrobium sp. 1_MG-2023]MDP2561006.1 guanosine-5'-triphosphate,3'-diphosphate pyrophosphatase [Psychrobium sp. 1_MG-2023]